MSHRISFGGCRAAVMALAALAGGCHGQSQNQLLTPDPVLKINAISLATGSPQGGTQITLWGEAFKAGTAVTFGGVPADVTEIRGTWLTVTVPPHAPGVVDVVITNADGTSATLKGGYRYADLPPPAPPTPPITIAGIGPNEVLVSGGAFVYVWGAGIETGATVTIDGIPTPAFPDDFPNTLFIFPVPPHAPGPVDVVVTNPDRSVAHLAGSLTYVSAVTFSPNGIWNGSPSVFESATFSFTVVDNMVTTVTCGGAAPVALSPPAAVVNGTFSYSGAGGTSMSGQLVAENQFRGTMNLPVCGAINWSASLR